MPTLNTANTPYYGGKQLQKPMEFRSGPGAPPTHVSQDTEVGSVFFLNKATNNFYGLAARAAGGVATWTLLGGSGTFPITPYTVGVLGEAGYQTVQAAINAANSAGGGLVFIQPGTYTENLTLRNNVMLLGANFYTTIITGVHTPPASGNVCFQNLTLTSSTDIFNSAAAGSTTLQILTCIVNCTNGYTFNLLNWTGTLVVDDCGDSSTNNGFVSNTGGATLFLTNAAMGAGTGNTASISGTNSFLYCQVKCPVNFVTGAIINVDNSNFANPITLSNNSTGVIDSSSIVGGASPAVTMSSSASVKIYNSDINSSNNPSIAGSGSGTLTLGNLTFLSNALTAGTLTIAWLPTKTGALTATGTTSVVGATSIVGAATINTTGNANTTIGNAAGSNAITINTGSGNLSITGNANTIGIGNDAAANQITIGATTSSAATIIQSGTGGIGMTGVTTVTGNVILGTAGNKVVVKTGSNASAGTTSAMTSGAIAVATTAVDASSIILLCPKTLGTVTSPQALYVSAINPGVSFAVVSAGATDTSTVNWWVIN